MKFVARRTQNAFMCKVAYSNKTMPTETIELTIFFDTIAVIVVDPGTLVESLSSSVLPCSSLPIAISFLTASQGPRLLQPYDAGLLANSSYNAGP